MQPVRAGQKLLRIALRDAQGASQVPGMGSALKVAQDQISQVENKTQTDLSLKQLVRPRTPSRRTPARQYSHCHCRTAAVVAPPRPQADRAIPAGSRRASVVQAHAWHVLPWYWELTWVVCCWTEPKQIRISDTSLNKPCCIAAALRVHCTLASVRGNEVCITRGH